MKRTDIMLRSAILGGVAALSLVFIVPAFQRPVDRSYSGVSYPSIGVSLFWERNVVVVRVDDREERVPTSELANSPIYQEAVARIPQRERPSDTTIRWPRVLRYWLPLVVITWWVLFRFWQPPRPYVEGPPA